MALVTLRQGSPGHRAYVIGAWIVVAAGILYVVFAHSLPVTLFSLDKGFRVSQINDVVAYAVAILGLNLVIGFSGQLSLGQSAFVGLGAYTTIVLVSDHHWSYFATIPVSAAVCFLVGLIVGLPALRIRGLYLAIVTLAVAYVFPTLVLKFESITGGPNGKKPDRGTAEMVPPSWMPFADDGRIAEPLWIFCVLIVIATVLFIAARNFIKSRPGRALIAVRDNQTSASVSGVNLALYKAMAFGVSAAFGGLAGSMLMINRPFASDVQFGLNLAIFLVVGLVAGGAGTISGAVPGALIYVFIPYFVSEWTLDQSGMPPGLKQATKPLFDWLEDRQGGDAISGVFFGAGLLAMVFLLPGGFVSGMRKLRARFVQVIPHPTWLTDVESDTGQPVEITETADTPEAGLLTT
jgi:branched-chain amino acid transport system permease protein